MTRILSWLLRPILPILLLVLVTGLISQPAGATGVYQMPSLSGGEKTWVIDDGDVISRLNEGKISTQVEQLAKETGNEVRFVTIRRLDYGETIDSFADQLFEKWFPTPEAQANQTLLVLDIVTNTSAIRTGANVDRTLPEGTAESIAAETLQVPLRQGNKYNQAFLDASDRLSLVLAGEPDPGPPVVVDNINTEGTFATPEETKESNATVWVIGLLIVATVIPMATYFWYQSFSS